MQIYQKVKYYSKEAVILRIEDKEVLIQVGKEIKWVDKDIITISSMK